MKDTFKQLTDKLESSSVRLDSADAVIVADKYINYKYYELGAMAGAGICGLLVITLGICLAGKLLKSMIQDCKTKCP